MRKIFALLLSLLLVVSVITGCGASKKTSNDGSTKISTSVSNEKQKNGQQLDNSKKLTAQNTTNANSVANVKAYAAEEKEAGVTGELSPKLLPVYTHGRDAR